MDRARSCANNCIFCFVDQMPPGMRESLYFKDDDARLSFLMGNYLTLTNLSQREVQRIIDLRISPINVSVHTTARSLRVEMLKNRRAGESIEIMRRFARHQITMNCQIVSCPGINDGPALDRTLRDLAEMFPAVHSVSVVPVGVTKYREGLYPRRPYTREEAGVVVDQVEAFAAAHRDAHGTALVWCSDEFYLLAGRPLPEEDYYEEFTQLDNGVGMLRLLRQEFRRGLDLMEAEEMERGRAPRSCPRPRLSRLQEVHIADGDLVVEALAGAAVVQPALALGVESGHRQCLGDVLVGRAVEDGGRDLPAEGLGGVAQMNLEHLADVHTGRNAQRVQHDIERRTVGHEGHILLRQDAGDNALVAVGSVITRIYKG